MTTPTRARPVDEGCDRARLRHLAYRSKLSTRIQRLSGVVRELQLAAAAANSEDEVATAAHKVAASLVAALPTARPSVGAFQAASRELRASLGRGDSDFTRLATYPADPPVQVAATDLVDRVEDMCADYRTVVLQTRNHKPRTEKDNLRDAAERELLRGLAGLVCLDASVRGPDSLREANRVWACVALNWVR